MYIQCILHLYCVSVWVNRLATYFRSRICEQIIFLFVCVCVGGGEGWGWEGNGKYIRLYSLYSIHEGTHFLKVMAVPYSKLFVQS